MLCHLLAGALGVKWWGHWRELGGDGPSTGCTEPPVWADGGRLTERTAQG